MNDTTMTIVGNVVDSPKLRRTKNGHLVANFRVATTPRRFDREQGAWVDGATLFVTVTCWRALGENVAKSLHKGQPIVVIGRYCQREYEREEILHTSYELEAIALGHDLTRGVASFQKVSRPSLVTPVEVDSDGNPADESDHFLDLVDDAVSEDARPDDAFTDSRSPQPVGGDVDLVTGEVRELAAAG